MNLLGLSDTLETKRCIIKISQESEAEEMWNLITEKITSYMIWSKSNSFQETYEQIKRTREKVLEKISWDASIYDRFSGKLLGRCGIVKITPDIPSFEIGYWLSEAYWGQGIMRECVTRLIIFAFEESTFEKVIIRCDSRNLNSQKVVLKCGFYFEGEFKNHERVKGELRDTKFFGLTRKDYFLKK